MNLPLVYSEGRRMKGGKIKCPAATNSFAMSLNVFSGSTVQERRKWRWGTVRHGKVRYSTCSSWSLYFTPLNTEINLGLDAKAREVFLGRTKATWADRGPRCSRILQYRAIYFSSTPPPLVEPSHPSFFYFFLIESLPKRTLNESHLE